MAFILSRIKTSEVFETSEVFYKKWKRGSKNVNQPKKPFLAHRAAQNVQESKSVHRGASSQRHEKFQADGQGAKNNKGGEN
jgi:hypothetical protein